MKRVSLLLSILALGLAGLLLAAAEHDARAEAPAPSFAAAALDSLQKIWMSVPDCPLTRSCTSGGPLCHDSAACGSDTDLGVSKCRQQMGGFFSCTGGQTVHEKAGCTCINAGGDCPSFGSYLICE
jgi:hypothetical protein